MADEPGGISIFMDITTPTVVKASAGRLALARSFITGAPPAGGGSIHNCTTVGAANDANKIVSFPTSGENPLTSYQIPCDAGIVVIPGNNTRVFVTYT